jgi:Uma2 family endonuclease
MATLMAGVESEGALKLRWTRGALDEAITAGILDPNARYEILNGELYEKMGQNWPHAFAIGALGIAFRSINLETCYASYQVPILADDDLPEPDFSVARGSIRSRADHPTGQELLLAVEVADTSLALDRNIKSGIYAASGVPVYWILDLKRSRVEVYSRPKDGRYSETRIFEVGETIPPMFEGSPSVDVADLIAPKPHGESS